MSERLTDEQLGEQIRFSPDEYEVEAATEILALRARVARLEVALIESRKLGMKIYHNANAHEAVKDWATVKAMMDDALKDAPQ